MTSIDSGSPQPRWADPAVLRSLFEQSPFSTVVYDAQGHPLALNPAFERLWGVGLQSVPPGYSVLADLELERNGLLPYIRRAFAGEEVSTPPAHYDIARVSGSTAGRAVWVTGHFFPIRDDAGALRFVVLVHTDVTERQEAENALRDSEARYRATFDEAPVGIAQVGLDGRVIAVNPTLERLLGRGRDELLGTDWQDITHPDDLPRERELAEQIMSGSRPAATIEKRYLLPDGGVAWARVTGTLVRAEDGAPRYVMVVIEDLSERVDAHRALDEVQRRSRALLESVTDPLVAYGRDWRIVYLNEPAREVFRRYGFQGDAIGQVVWDIVPALPGGEVHRAMLEAMDANVPRTFEVRQLSGFWLEIRTYPMPDGLVAYWTNVTERHKSRERTELLASASSALAENVHVDAALMALMHLVARSQADYVTVHLAEPDGGLRLVDAVHRDPERTAVAREIERTYPLPADAPVGAAAVIRSGEASLQRDLPWDRVKLAARDARHLALLEQIGMVSTIVVPLRARGRVLGALTLVSAESGRRYDERDLELAEELARRAALAVDNARLFSEAERARFAAEDASRAKTQFLATMSHELRTPLNAISGYASLMEMGVRGPISDAQRADLESIQRSQRHLTTIINEILDYARIETGAVSLKRQSTSLAPVVLAAAALIEPQRVARGIAFESRVPDDAPAVLADAEKLQQVLLNLFSNAVKFTPGGGSIRVDAAATGAGTVALGVSDTGVGVPPDKLEVIFEPFVQVGRALNNPGEGTGLGLAISRDLARAMGGDLVAQSAQGQGSVFVLTLPAA